MFWKRFPVAFVAVFLQSLYNKRCRLIRLSISTEGENSTSKLWIFSYHFYDVIR